MHPAQHVPFDHHQRLGRLDFERERDVADFVRIQVEVDRGADALKQAQQKGHTPNDREIALLGDGYRARGQALVRNARKLAGLPQERDYLSRAADAYRQAIESGQVPGQFRDLVRDYFSSLEP